MKWMQEFNFLSLHWQADLLLGPFCAYWSVLQCHDPVPGWLPGAHSCPPCLWFQQMVSGGITTSHRLDHKLSLQSLQLLARLMSNSMFLFRTREFISQCNKRQKLQIPWEHMQVFAQHVCSCLFWVHFSMSPQATSLALVQDPGSLVSLSDKLQLLLSIQCQAVLIWLSRSSLCWSHLFSLQWEVLLCKIRAQAFILVSGSFLWL